MPPKHSVRAHAKYFSPSKADTWVDCTASPHFVEKLGIKDTSSAAAAEGNAAHELLEACLSSMKPPKKFLGKVFNGHTAGEEMVHFVTMVYDWVMGKIADGYELKAERRVRIQCTGDEGTTDITLWHPGTKHLIVVDLKYGKGYVVDPTKNRQMRLYACGTCDEDKLWDVMQRLTLVIWQPRVSEEPSEWEDSPKGLKFFRGKIAEIVETIRRKEGVFRPSEKSCQWCPAKAMCKAYAKHACEVAKVDFAEVLKKEQISTPDCEAMTLDDLFSVWKNAGQLTSYLKGVSERIFTLAMEGKLADKVKLVEGKSNRQWVSEGDTMDALSRMGYKADQFAPRALAGLGVIERLFPKKADRTRFMQKYTHKPKGNPSLADLDDPRPTYVRDEFAEVEL